MRKKIELRIKSFLTVLFIFFSMPLMAQPTEQIPFCYGSLGTIGGYPTLGAGYRIQHGHHALDFSGKFIPYFSGKCMPCCPVADLQGLYLLYPGRTGLYLGSGFGFIWEGENVPRGSVMFESAVGYQWTTRQGKNLLLQVEGIVPFKNMTAVAPIWPGLTFGMRF